MGILIVHSGTKLTTMKVPFNLPLIDEAVVGEMQDTLLRTTWLTSGPKVKAFEQELLKQTNAKQILCVNSWNSGTSLMLKWWGIEPGDEVIIPAYTYAATGICPLNLGATVKIVDVGTDFNIDVAKIKEAITEKTKAIIPVDLGGLPCDYAAIHQLIESPEIKALFKPANEKQEKLGRILVIGDAAHSIGATYEGKQSGSITDLAVFSFHSVKNITTGEGGAICFNLPAPFDNEEVHKYVKTFALYGQTKNAFEKNQVGKWRYDIIYQGMKCNMPDICATIGLAQIRTYESVLLPRRKEIYSLYYQGFANHSWAELPIYHTTEKTSSCHLFPLRIKGISEDTRNKIIQQISEMGIGVNVHYVPLPMLTLYKNMGFDIADYPVAYDNYSREISLPIYTTLKNEQIAHVIKNVIHICEEVLQLNKVAV